MKTLGPYYLKFSIFNFCFMVLSVNCCTSDYLVFALMYPRDFIDVGRTIYANFALDLLLPLAVCCFL